MISKERIKYLIGIEELEAGQKEEVVIVTSSVKEKVLMLLSCFTVAILVSGFFLKFYKLYSIYEVTEGEYQLANQYVVSSSPFALRSFEAGDLVVVDFGDGYNLTTPITSLWGNGFLISNQQGIPQYFDYEMIKGKVVNNPSSWFFTYVAKFLKYTSERR